MAQFTTLIITSMNDMKTTFPEMSFGEILYTIFRKNNFPNKAEGVNTSWLLEVKDEDIYKSIEKAIRNDKNEG